jgi:uncharacterized spore protein YtfJ
LGEVPLAGEPEQHGQARVHADRAEHLLGRRDAHDEQVVADHASSLERSGEGRTTSGAAPPRRPAPAGDQECWDRSVPTDEEDVMAEGQRLLDRLAEVASVRRVFGEPTEQDGSTVIPVARVIGFGGGGGGTRDGGADGGERGGGGGGVVVVSPVGAFVVRGGEVTWQPAVDVSQIVLGGQFLALVALLTVRSVLRRRARRRRS